MVARQLLNQWFFVTLDNHLISYVATYNKQDVITLIHCVFSYLVFYITLESIFNLQHQKTTDAYVLFLDFHDHYRTK